MADSAAKPSSSVKLVLLGEAAVGKSSLVLRFVNNTFQENKEPTIGAAFLTQKCNLPNRTIKFEIWDTAGQERFASLAPMYYRNAQAAVIVYDLTKASSLVKAQHWVAELQRQVSPGIIIALVGNKYDLADGSSGSAGFAGDGDSYDDDEATLNDARELDPLGSTDLPTSKGQSNPRQVSTSQGKSYAEQESLLFFETSAKTGLNVAEVFAAIANSIPETQLKGHRGAATQATSGFNARPEDARVNLNPGGDLGPKEGCGC